MAATDRLLSVAHKRRIGIRAELSRWASSNLRDFPWRRERTPYRIMVAEFLLKRTTSTAVARVYDNFLSQYPTIEELVRADTGKLESILKAIGYHRVRAKAMKETATNIVENYGGEIPSDFDALTSVPNIGHYTAGAILSLGFGILAPMVDSNVERILRRAFRDTLPEKAVPKALLTIAKELVPNKWHDIFNLALVDLGAKVCTYRIPYCDRCPIRRSCDTGIEAAA